MQNARRVFAGAVLYVVASLQYLLAEIITASAWHRPPYSYTNNFISDLGVPGCPEVTQTRVICSPLNAVMNTGFVIQSTLFVVVAILLFVIVARRWRVAYLVLAILFGIGLTLVAIFHGSAANMANGTLIYHQVGSIEAIVGANVAAIIVGTKMVALAVPRWYRRTSITLGVVGISAVVILFLSNAVFGFTIATPNGIWERTAVYTIVGWQLVTGFFLITRVRRGELSHSTLSTPTSATVDA